MQCDRKSFAQRVVTKLLPRRAEEIERESREWLVSCPRCGYERSVWEMGGVRYRAWSKGKADVVQVPGMWPAGLAQGRASAACPVSASEIPAVAGLS